MIKAKYLLVGIVLILMVCSTTGSLGFTIEHKKIDNIACEKHLLPRGPVLEVTTDKETYSQGELVTIFLTNVGDEVLSGGGPIVTIYNEENEIVYQLGAYCWVELEPGECIDWWPPWDQTDEQGEQVPVGSYIVEGFLSNHEDGYSDTAIFYIVN